MSLILNIFALIPFYLLGSFPSGLLIARSKGIDISQHGSGNVGATNISRVLGKRSGALTLLLDVSKGSLAVLIAQLISNDLNFIASCGAAAVLGHCLSIPPLLKGGKGVATALGVFLVLTPRCAAFAVIIFAIMFTWLHWVSLASITAALVTPLFALLISLDSAITLALIVIGLVVTARHHQNIRRLIEGQEPRYK